VTEWGNDLRQGNPGIAGLHRLDTECLLGTARRRCASCWRRRLPVLVHLPDGDALTGVIGRIQSNRALDERQLEVALPMGPRGHSPLHVIQKGMPVKWSGISTFLRACDEENWSFLICSIVATHTFVNPIIAVALGWGVLGEQPTWATLAGTALVVFSVAGTILTVTPASGWRKTRKDPKRRPNAR
jgi:hypothetical protein